MARDGLVSCFTSSGVPRWDHPFGGSGCDAVGQVIVDADGNVIIGASFNGSVDFGGGIRIASDADAVLFGLAPTTGAYLWDRTSGGVGDDGLWGIGGARLSDGFLVAGMVGHAPDAACGGFNFTQERDFYLALQR
jgi:hypothetical protein